MTRMRWGVGLILAAAAISAFGLRHLTGKDDDKDLAEVKKVVEQIEKKLRAKEIGTSLDGLAAMNQKLLTEKEKNDPNRVIPPSASVLMEKDFGRLHPEMGEFSGELELLGTKRGGDSFVQYLYLMRFARGASVLRLDFYRTPSHGWMSHGVRWGTPDSPFEYLK